MSIESADCESIIWATRGRDWGFRFLLDAGLSDPLPDYERAFGSLRDAPAAWRRHDGHVALRILDPLERRDSAGRVIPHEFVVYGDLAAAVESVEDGMHKVWPLVSEIYASAWDASTPPDLSNRALIARHTR
ncbi:hypothetical protein ASG56_08260 [Rhodococcus sp. Leaf7]|uniref:hypothetical protein n=1 Tax=unclassified Rhodococcus (in: high G+C Gram-positive bacteria) TaxID=192944 RepID=UPI000713FDF3|nr:MULTISPECIES: hypothetical protein [unclassified Rhodococcus (in: high G+C Gram-positive bacteria)]KQU07482.1 hypothetical protein ASG56_08260 [Rhodococcus sp. Leaf7]